jgi:hypothetical protein
MKPSAASRTPSWRARLFGDLDDDPRWAWATRRPVRRAAVAVQALLLVGALTALALGRPVVALLLGAPFFPLMSVINIGIHGLLDVPLRDLDDVLVRVRDAATRRAYTVLTVLLGLVAVASPFLASGIELAFAADPRQAIMRAAAGAFGLFFVALLLPTWLVALRLPDGAEAEREPLPGS